MSVLFFDSFDHYTNNTPNFLEALTQEYNVDFNYGNVPHLLSGRHSNYSCYFPFHSIDSYLFKTIGLLNPTTYLIFGFQFKKIGIQSDSQFEILFTNPAYTQDYNKISFNSSGVKFATSTEISSSVATISDEEWHHVEIKIYYPGVGTWRIYIDGEEAGTWTPSSTIDWEQTVSLKVSVFPGASFLITNNASKGWLVDDFYVLDDFGNDYNNFLGTDVRIETIKPIQDLVSELAEINTINGYESQDNIPVNPTQYITTSFNVEDNTTFEYENLSVIKDIGAVKQTTFIYAYDLNDFRHCDFVFLKNDQEVGATILKKSEPEFINDRLKSKLFNLDPETSNHWSKANFNASNFGIKTKQNKDMNIIAVKDSMSDLYFPILTDSRRFEATAYILIFGDNTLVNPDETIWTVIDSGITMGIGGAGDPTSNYMLVSKKLSGLENETMIAAEQSITNHLFALIFITSWYDSELNEIVSITENSGSKTFPSFTYDFTSNKAAVSAIRVLAPVGPYAGSVAATSVTGVAAAGFTEITLSFSKFYYLTESFIPEIPGDSSPHTEGGIMTGTTIDDSSYMTISFFK